MKLVKMSLLAATLIASSAFAIDNTKVSGDAKLYYGTADNDGADLFNKEGAYGQAAAKVGLTTDLTEHVSAGVSITALSTLGMQGQIVADDGVWEDTNGVDDSFWFDQVWLAGTVGKTTGKIGRMELDTPLVFSETLSVATNTFEAAVLINQDIPDTTLVGAYVGGSNGGSLARLADGKVAVISPTTNDGSANIGSATNFHQFYNGAYTAGLVNNSWTPMTVQGWYYNATSVADAYWLQADVALDMGLILGAQFTGLNVKQGALANVGKLGAAGLPDDSSNTAFALMAGYEMTDVFAVKGSFSQTGDEQNNGGLIGAGMNLAASGQSKLYTEAWWNAGFITKNDTSAFNVTVTTPEALTWAALGLYYTQSTSADQLVLTTGTEDLELSELTLTASKSFGALDTSIAYVYTNAGTLNAEFDAANDQTKKGEGFNNLQLYLTYNF